MVWFLSYILTYYTWKLVENWRKLNRGEISRSLFKRGGPIWHSRKHTAGKGGYILPTPVRIKPSSRHMNKVYHAFYSTEKFPRKPFQNQNLLTCNAIFQAISDLLMKCIEKTVPKSCTFMGSKLKLNFVYFYTCHKLALLNIVSQ